MYDTRMFRVLSTLAQCLSAQITQADLPGVCFIGTLPGAQIALDHSGNCSDVCGQAWTRLVNIYPSNGVGDPNEEPGNCGGGLDAVIEVGIMRCAPLPDSSGNPPSEDDMLAATDLQMADAMAMLRAIVCCEDISSKDYIVMGYLPAGPLGDQVGGTWTVTVAVA